MSSITVLENPSQALAPEVMTMDAPEMAPVEVAVPGRRFTLKRTGQRPLSFDGREVCTATSHAIGPCLWYEVNVYQKTDGFYVAEVKMFHKSEGQKDIFRAFEATSLDDVAMVLERYSPSDDIACRLLLNDYMPAGRFALAAAALKLEIEEANVQFQDLVGELLFQLCE